MIAKLKIAAYVILTILAVWFGRAFYSNYSKIGQPAAPPATNAAPVPTNQTTEAAPVAATNQSTNILTETNNDTGSNIVQQPATNAALATNTTASNSPVTPAPPDTTTPPPAANSGSRSVGYLAAFVLTMIGLGVLIAYDLTQFLGSRAVEYLFNDEGEGARDPEYERAEQTWVNGKPLEAIQMMREYLKKNPREQYVALRIAEIYEKDLRNYVAATLEYEEVLKKKLPAERWGWAAIHLCNLYARMGKQDQMRALLERIARDYPKTGAAKKARRNLGLPEPAEDAAAPAAVPEEPPSEQNPDEGEVFDLDQVIATPDEQSPEPPPAKPEKREKPAPAEPPKSNLPPGFRKK